MNLWIVGSGIMAQEYVKVLRELKVDNIVIIGRGEDSASKFEEATGLAVQRGGLTQFLKNQPQLPSAAILTVPINELAPAATQLLEAGVRKILMEKPAGLYVKEINTLNTYAQTVKADVYVGYNRRFYTSVRMAHQMIQEDGGVKSFNFEFTEWENKIAELPTPSMIKERWLLGNSSHVIDLAFHLGGMPEVIHTLQAGGLSWHPNASIFTGAGCTKNGALFSYQANWEAPGRWGIELCSANYRFVFRPLESLSIIEKGSLILNQVELGPNDIEKDFKPGLFLQTEAFINSNLQSPLCSLSEHSRMLSFYTQIAQYSD
jgi:predicted dehydrogenase